MTLSYPLIKYFDFMSHVGLNPSIHRNTLKIALTWLLVLAQHNDDEGKTQR